MKYGTRYQINQYYITCECIRLFTRMYLNVQMISIQDNMSFFAVNICSTHELYVSIHILINISVLQIEKLL